MISKIKLISLKDNDKEIEIEHDHLPQYNLKYLNVKNVSEWLPIKFKNNVDSGYYDEALLEVNKKVSYKLSHVEINSDSKELHFNDVETIFKF